MCSRITLTIPDAATLARMLGAEFDEPATAEAYRARFNVAPTQSHVVMRGERRLVDAMWGFGPRRQTNTRVETVLRRRGLGVQQRCVVPADGFFEWTGPKSARRPIWFHPSGQGLLLFAGLFTDDPDGRRFAVVTMDARDPVAAIHDRMPVIFDAAMADAWLRSRDDEALRRLLTSPAAIALLSTAVSTRVNSAANDDADCLKPASEERAKSEQLKLL